MGMALWIRLVVCGIFLRVHTPAAGFSDLLIIQFSDRILGVPLAKASGPALRCKASLPSVGPGFPLRSVTRVPVLPEVPS